MWRIIGCAKVTLDCINTINNCLHRDQAGRPKCPIDPFYIVPDKCKCVDFQVLKMQEAPEAVPNGELPRHLQLYCDRYLCEKVVPGNRVTVVGVYAIKKSAKPSKVWPNICYYIFFTIFNTNSINLVIHLQPWWKHDHPFSSFNCCAFSCERG